MDRCTHKVCIMYYICIISANADQTLIYFNFNFGCNLIFILIIIVHKS